jgi:nucleotide-binding universal stress UspA family protein
MKEVEIKKILVPIDFSETSDRVMYEAATLAKSLKADIYLIHIIETNGLYSSFDERIKTNNPAYEDLDVAVKERMDEIRMEMKKEFGINSEVFISQGEVHTEIIAYSKQENIDLIVMGAHGVSGYKEIFIGSNAQRVVTLSDTPVLTMRKNNNKDSFENILLPIDNSSHSREKVNIAMVIAQLHGANIHLIGLPDSHDEVELRELKIKLKSVEDILIEDKLPFETNIVHGDNLSEAAMKYAAKFNCDLIVINTGHESKITGHFLGAFAQQIVNHSKVPVLSVRAKKDSVMITAPGYGIS